MRSYLSAFATSLRFDQRGATAVEYGIMVSLIAVVIIVAVTLLGGTLHDTFVQVQCSVGSGTFTPAAAGAAGTASCAP
ncbi:Flp family type IVb pilin [Arthrobacter sp. PM3]|uniref:Flp family type IVb pilin n=1 Tax=Arthrobacter sp. PM3 TaxID=2017685 RepID=UPI000E102C70|nr:Flp family type IVb pilin [Arthrobacter sp. PM3]AXJ08254.1 Flp family type IVb pilin [Arthrobacter sp. PM3]